MPEKSERFKKAEERYHAAAHALQSGVALRISLGHVEDTTPKSLRVGINISMSDHAALAKLLMNKGIFTEEEYMEYLAKWMEVEVKDYEKMLGTKLL